VHAFGGATISGAGRSWLLLRALMAILREHQKGRFDVFHALWADEPGLVALIVSSLTGVPAVVSLLGGELIEMQEINYGHQLSRFARLAVRQSLTYIRHITVGSQSLKKRAMEQNHVPETRLTVIPLGVDTDLFTPEGKTQSLAGGFKLLHVASLSPIKNQTLLLRAVGIAAETLPELHLHIVGDGALRPVLEKMTNDLGITSKVTFHGDVTHENLPEFYRAADLCLLTSHYESQSMVALEAGACGKLTVGTAVGILPELLPPDLMVSPDAKDASEALTRIILRLAQDGDLRERLRQQVHQQVVTQYDLATSLQRWEAVYAAAIADKQLRSTRQSSRTAPE
ncbi:MAG TPA: glycosyltransferase family 4 protein, partial [Phototrophicaceae bacterium]|nr:glycosyltransferase family 4 protein [Phototrophicaceae bacterium]